MISYTYIEIATKSVHICLKNREKSVAMRKIVCMVMLLIASLWLCACKSEKVAIGESGSETKNENVETIEEFEEDGELYYRKSGNVYEIVYRRLEAEIVSKELIMEYEPVSLTGQMVGTSDERSRLYAQQMHIPNVYSGDESVSKVELTLYNCSGFFWDGMPKFSQGFKSFRNCESVMAELDTKKMASLALIYYCPPKYTSLGLTDSSAEQCAIEASIMDETIIKADITYTDNSLKTEYLGFESYNGKHCNYMSIYRLEVK